MSEASLAIGDGGQMTAFRSGSLSPGQALVTANGRQGTIGALLGAGGQGEVYRVTVEGLPMALKWYHAHYIGLDTGLRTRLETAVRRGAPTASFLWPIDMVTVPGQDSFGYLMPLRADRYRSIRDLIAPPPHRLELTLAQRGLICLQLVESFLELHVAGFCYQDINFGNIFLDPDSASILICDNDNVNVDGADASIYGARKFMAPEVVRRETLPNSRTDLFSMAVLFFYALFGWHPLDGKREHEESVMDAEAERRLYGTDPLFLFDPHDQANGPVEGFHDPLVLRWQCLPPSLRQLFERAFGPGLHDPGARVLETEWRGALGTLVDAAYACDTCGLEQVATPGADLFRTCLACAAPLAWPLALALGPRIILLDEGRDVVLAPRDRFDPPAARVEAHPSKPGLLGLRNLSGKDWRVTLPDASAYRVEDDRTVRIIAGARIEFDRTTGEIIDLNEQVTA